MFTNLTTELKRHWTNPVNTKHLYDIYTTSAQRLRRWSNIVEMLYKCFVFTGNGWRCHSPTCRSRFSPSHPVAPSSKRSRKAFSAGLWTDTICAPSCTQLELASCQLSAPSCNLQQRVISHWWHHLAGTLQAKRPTFSCKKIRKTKHHMAAILPRVNLV